MRIAFVSQAYAPVRGGSEWVAQQLSERLLARGHEVRVFTSTARHDVGFSDPTAPSMPPGEDHVNGVPVTRFPIRFGLQRTCHAVGKLSARLRLLPFGEACDAHRAGPALLGVARSVAAWRPDLAVAIPAAASILPYALWARRRAHGKLAAAVIPCFHAHEVTSNNPQVISRIAQADGVAVFTAHERDELVAQGVERDRVTVAGLGTDRVPLEAQAAAGRDFRDKHGLGRSPVIAFVGRKQRYKGPWFLVEAMQQVWPRLPDARLIIAGGRTVESPRMQRDLERLPSGYRSRIVWIDDFSEEERQGIFAAADVIALPSLYESFGLVYLDAWIRKKPVIGCRLGSTSSLIRDGEDGLLVTFGVNRELAHAALRLLAAPTFRARMGEAGYRKAIELYTWDKVIERYEAAWDQAVAHARRSARGGT